MWNSCNKMQRLENSLRMRGLDPDNLSLKDLAIVLRQRRISDRRLNPIVWTLVSVLEPPGCEMTHCKHYGNSAAPMNCSEGRIPGGCGILKDYRRRKKNRDANAGTGPRALPKSGGISP